MFGRRQEEIVIEPEEKSEDVLISFSEPVQITKGLKISIPSHYKAIAFIEEKPEIRLEPCVKKDFVKEYGKKYIGKQLKIAYIRVRTMAQNAWGFGNINVNNTRLKEAYVVGANGKFMVDIVDYVRMIQAFPSSSEITISQIREKIISTIRSVGTPILGKFFSNTETSVFEISSLLDEFRNKFFENLTNEKIFTNLGVKISSLTVDGFHVREEDLETIRNRING
ncbi:MAG: hypothetical protein IJX17_01585 [Clostridia bacterium]|nr:hypothetical protein [Clostridia bacterium]